MHVKSIDTGSGQWIDLTPIVPKFFVSGITVYKNMIWTRPSRTKNWSWRSRYREKSIMSPRRPIRYDSIYRYQSDIFDTSKHHYCRFLWRRSRSVLLSSLGCFKVGWICGAKMTLLWRSESLLRPIWSAAMAPCMKKIGSDAAGCLVAKSEVTAFIERCMVAVGTKPDHAKALADNLTMADYRGHFSHGLNRLGN